MFGAGSWPSQYSQDWQETAKSLKSRGVDIYAYGIKPGAQKEQLESITLLPSYSYLLDSYTMPRVIPTGVTSEYFFVIAFFNN